MTRSSTMIKFISAKFKGSLSVRACEFSIQKENIFQIYIYISTQMTFLLNVGQCTQRMLRTIQRTVSTSYEALKETCVTMFCKAIALKCPPYSTSSGLYFLTIAIDIKSSIKPLKRKMYKSQINVFVFACQFLNNGTFKMTLMIP